MIIFGIYSWEHLEGSLPNKCVETSASSGPQLVPVEIPIDCWNNSPQSWTNMLSIINLTFEWSCPVYIYVVPH